MPHPHIDELLEKNRVWSAETKSRDPDFFARLSKQQTPKYLWIGCADSRVPASQVVGMDPGHLFVHRNIANVVVHSDVNCLSVIQYAVEVLKVEHVVVCGHYGCGGVKAALDKPELGLIEHWLRHIEDVAHRHADRLNNVNEPETRCDRLCELNVIEQVMNLARTTTVRTAWQRGQTLVLHGLIYGLKDGLLRDLGLDLAGPDDAAQSYDRVLKRLPTD